MMPNKELEKFLTEMGISEEDFNKSKLNWKTLKAIKSEYEKNLEAYEKIAFQYVEELSKIKSVHSVRYRVKNVYHLLEKIVRKTNEGEQITKDNYTTCIPDIIGIRVLYVFKSDWKKLHEDIKQKYHRLFTQKPEVQLKKGDDESPYKNVRNIEIKENKDYRSIHYVIKHEAFDTNTGNKLLEVRIEIQTRSIFEEGWSEINHNLIYKKQLDIDIQEHANALSSILSSLAGECDQLGEELKRISTITKNSAQTIAKEEKILQEDSSENIKMTGADIVDVMERFLDNPPQK